MPELLSLPPLVDVHVHLRQPSPLNRAETIANGTRAALIGGYALIADMPNNPGHPTWTTDRLIEKRNIAAAGAWIPTVFHAGSQPESDNLDELERMADFAAGLKLYGAPTTGNHNDYTADDFKDIVAEWHKVAPNKTILLHAGKENLADMIDLVAGKYLHPLHICHVNDPADVEMVSEARANGLSVTCGVTPHHLFKTSHDIKSEGWLARMQPELACQDDSEELFEMLADGQIDIVESDYAPHSLDAKLKAETENPDGVHDEHHSTCYGVPGIEHIPQMMLYQLQRGAISLERLIEAMSTKPAEILGIKPKGETLWHLKPGVIKERSIQSGAHWSPYIGKLAGGTLVESQIGGQTVYANGRPLKRNYIPYP